MSLLRRLAPVFACAYVVGLGFLTGCAAPTGPATEPAQVREPDSAPALAVPPPSAPCAGDAGATAPSDAGPTWLDSAPAQWTDAGWVTTIYTAARSGSYTGAEGVQRILCDSPTDELLSGACVANGGTITTSAMRLPNGWVCVAKPDVPAKGVEVIAIVECRRAQ